MIADGHGNLPNGIGSKIRLMPPYLTSNQVWVDLASSIDEVFKGLSEAPYDIANIRFPFKLITVQGEKLLSYENNLVPYEREILIKTANQLGFNFFNSDTLLSFDYSRLVQNIGQYNTQKGTENFANFLGFCIDTLFEIKNLWSIDYGTFVSEESVSQEDKITEGGPYFPTTHVSLEYDFTRFPGLTNDKILSLFNWFANINLVLQSIKLKGTNYADIFVNAAASTQIRIGFDEEEESNVISAASGMLIIYGTNAGYTPLPTPTPLPEDVVITDIGVQLLVSNVLVDQGDSITFTAQATNYGPNDATNVHLGTNFGSNFVVTDVLITLQGLASNVTGSGNYNIASLPVASSVTVTVQGFYSVGGTYNAVASVSHTLTDSNIGNNTDSQTIQVNALVVLPTPIITGIYAPDLLPTPVITGIYSPDIVLPAPTITGIYSPEIVLPTPIIEGIYSRLPKPSVTVIDDSLPTPVIDGIYYELPKPSVTSASYYLPKPGVVVHSDELPEWSVVFTQSLTSYNGGWGGYTQRFKYSIPEGTKLRLRITFLGLGDGDRMQIHSMYVQRSDGGFGFASTPVPITFNNGSASMNGNLEPGMEVYSDEIDFVHDGTVDLVFSVYYLAGGIMQKTASPDSPSQYLAGNHASTLTFSGILWGWFPLVNQIEILS